MKTKLAIIITLVAVAASIATARTKTTQTQLKNNSMIVEQIPDANVPDSLLRDLEPNAVTLKGYNKKASDSRESFFVTNNTNHRISHIRLLMRYSQMNGEMLHERTATVEVDLRPGETRLVAIKTFDVQRLFYYYAGPKPRKSATPFKVAFRLIGYDIPVGM
ncbi:MAG: hypothetical protein IK100_03330 [Muribaculaceae bacterium]|nr:hypothetical protein [Muribaculaceae bacterium]MBR5117665.1 hypothetical protein [Muribaculaceae bacterium]